MPMVTLISGKAVLPEQKANNEEPRKKEKPNSEDLWIKPLDGSVDRFRFVAGKDPCGPCAPCKGPCGTPCGRVCHPCGSPCGIPDPCNK